MIAACLAIAALAALLAYREWLHTRERADLLQRIQAPHLAVMDHADPQPARSIGFDSDEEFWAAVEDRNG